MAVKRQVLFFVCAVIVTASYGVTRAAQGKNHASLAHLPALYFYDKSDKKVTLDDFKGKVVLVNLWATWCTPCVAELPSLDRLQKALPGDKFRVVAISMDTKLSMQDIAGFLKKQGVRNLEVYWDKDRQVPLKWKYEGLPTSFLLDREGAVVKRYDGPEIWDKGSVVGEVREMTLKDTIKPAAR